MRLRTFWLGRGDERGGGAEFSGAAHQRQNNSAGGGKGTDQAPVLRGGGRRFNTTVPRTGRGGGRGGFSGTVAADHHNQNHNNNNTTTSASAATAPIAGGGTDQAQAPLPPPSSVLRGGGSGRYNKYAQLTAAPTPIPLVRPRGRSRGGSSCVFPPPYRVTPMEKCKEWVGNIPQNPPDVEEPVRAQDEHQFVEQRGPIVGQQQQRYLMAPKPPLHRDTATTIDQVEQRGPIVVQQQQRYVMAPKPPRHRDTDTTDEVFSSAPPSPPASHSPPAAPVPVGAANSARCHACELRDTFTRLCEFFGAEMNRVQHNHPQNNNNE